MKIVEDIGARVRDALNTKIKLTEKGAANGIATLDANGKIPDAQLPPLAITDTTVVADEAEMLALTVEPGDVAVRNDLSKSFILKTAPATDVNNWIELKTPVSAVQSVAGKTGVVTLVGNDITDLGSYAEFLAVFETGLL